jgi:hypothetical protein
VTTINTDIIQSSLQEKLDATTVLTESKEFLVLSKSMESLVGFISVGEIQDTGITQVALVVDEGTTQTDLLVAEGTTQTGLVTDEGDAQIQRVTDEGDTQISAVQAIADDISFKNVAEDRTASINMNDNLLLSPEIRDYSETVQAMVADDVDCALGSVQTKTVSSNTTLTFSNPPVSGKSSAFTLILQLSNSALVTWPASVQWSYDGAIPELTTTGTDIFTFMTTDGGTIWYGFVAGKEMG